MNREGKVAQAKAMLPKINELKAKIAAKQKEDQHAEQEFLALRATISPDEDDEETTTTTLSMAPPQSRTTTMPQAPRSIDTPQNNPTQSQMPVPNRPTQPTQSQSRSQNNPHPQRAAIELIEDDEVVEATRRIELLISHVTERYNEYVVLFREYKSQNMEAEKQALIPLIKQLREALNAARSGVLVDMNKLPPKPQRKDVEDNFHIIPAAVVPKISAKEQKRINEFEQLMKDLTDQIRDLNAKAQELSKSTLKEDKVQAVLLHRKQTELLAQLKDIKEAKELGAAVPLYHYDSEEIKEEIINTSVAENEIELHILSCKNVPPPTGVTTPQLYAYVEFPYPSNTVQKLQSSPGVTLSPVLNFVGKLNISRQRSFSLFCSRKVLYVEIWHKKRFGRDVYIGRAGVPLSGILTSCTIKDSAPICFKKSRRKSGGTVRYCVRVRTPLDSKEFRSYIKKTLVIDSIDKTPLVAEQTTISLQAPLTRTPTVQPTPTRIPTVQPTPTPTVQPTPAKRPETQIRSPAVSTIPPETQATKGELPHPIATIPPEKKEETVQTTPQQPVVVTVSSPQVLESPRKVAQGVQQKAPIASSGTDGEVEMFDPESVMDVVSNNVLAWELARVNAELAKNGPSEPVLSRKQEIELKVQMLMIQIETGQLTEEGYIKKLNDKIASDTLLVKKLAQAKKRDEAKIVLKRIKLMRGELAGQ
eukprot:TRINITY_DN376_c0_g1_i2.p1 TRINITY_DN376_c0_g1~~TRINITY_DN376_c0_g1_i2.p1  ORF type:complete len:819 (-),score=183.52 TRINITY_DN376_c0_g1_i2:191-2296(-)